MTNREQSLKEVDCLTFDDFEISCYPQCLKGFLADFSDALIFFQEQAFSCGRGLSLYRVVKVIDENSMLGLHSKKRELFFQVTG